MENTLVALTIIFSSGIYSAGFIRFSFWLIYFLALIALLFSFLSVKEKVKFNIFLACLIFLCGAISLTNAKALPGHHILHYASYKNKEPYIVKGFINTQPLTKNNRGSFVFGVKEIQFNNFKVRTSGNILVHAKNGKDLRYGQELILTGNLYRPFGYNGSGRNSYRDYLANNGIFLIMNAKAVRQENGLNQDKLLIPKGIILRLKGAIEKIIFKRVSFLSASILDAMMLGEKKNISPIVYNSMLRSGTLHILVVSGFNVGIVAFIVILILRLMRFSRRARIYITIPLLVVYCFLTAAANPVVRATIMAIVFMAAYFFKKQADIYNSCAIAALLILGFSPRQLFDVGFRLSFASVIAIVYLYPKIKSFLHIDAIKIRLLRSLACSFLVSFSAWFGTAGFIAYYFRVFSPVTVLANMFIVPIAAFITLCGFCLVIIELALPPLAGLFASTCELSVWLLLKVNAFLIKLPFAYFYFS